jgi:integrase
MIKRNGMKEFNDLKELLKKYVDNIEIKDGTMTMTGLKLFEMTIDKVEIESELDSELFRQDISHLIDEATSKAANIVHDSSTSESSMRLSELTELFISTMECAGRIKNKTIDAYKAEVRDFISIISDLPVKEINDKEIMDYRKVLEKLPPNLSKIAHLKDLPLVEVAKINTGAKLASQTVRNKMNRISALMNFALKRKLINYNPVETLLPIRSEKGSESRTQFSDEEIVQLIDNNEIMKFRKDMSTYAYYLIFLGIYTGARINELCSLRSCDFYIKDQDIPFIKIESYTDTETGVQISPKNKNSNRIIPIHKELFRLGFVDYVLTCQEIGLYRIFPELRLQRDGLATTASKWFSRFKGRHLSSESKGKKTYHSFRHTFINKLHNADVKLQQIELIVGHQEQSRSTINRNYIDLPSLKVLNQAMTNLHYDIPSNLTQKFNRVSRELTREAKRFFTDQK